MASQTVSGVRAKLSREAQRNSRKISGVKPLTPGADSAKAARASIEVVVAPARDALLTDFGRATLQDRYLLAGDRKSNV